MSCYVSVFLGSGNLAAMGILEDRFKANMDVSCLFLTCSWQCFYRCPVAQGAATVNATEKKYLLY